MTKLRISDLPERKYRVARDLQLNRLQPFSLTKPSGNDSIILEAGFLYRIEDSVKFGIEGGSQIKY